MFERFTVDRVAEAIHTEVESGNPDSKLSHRFFRKGRRDGRRTLPTQASQELIIDAVGVACSRLAENYLAAKQQLLIQQRSAAIQETALAEDPKANPKTKTAAASSASTSSDPDIAAAFAARETARAEAEAARRRSEAEAQQTQRRNFKVQEASVEAQLETLLDRLRQQVATCERVGELLWDRYCDGYSYGQRGRLKRQEVEPTPLDTTITFPPVAVLSQTTPAETEGEVS